MGNSKEYIEVSEQEFRDYIKSYPRRLTPNHNNPFTDEQYNDFTLGDWPESVVAFRKPRHPEGWKYYRKNESFVCLGRALNIALFKDEITSDCEYDRTGKTLRWTRKFGRGLPEKVNKIEIDWNKRTLIVDGEVYFYP